MIFKIRIFDKHERQYFEDGELKTEAISDDEWHRFDFYLETDRIRIDSFKEYVLFDKDENPTRCTKIFLSDLSHIYCCSSAETFEKQYNEFMEKLKEYEKLNPPT